MAYLSLLAAPLAFIESIIFFFAFLTTPYRVWEGNYWQKLDKSGFFFNHTVDALPQTAMQKIVRDFYTQPLPAGKKEKKVAVVGFDGCRADGLLLLKDDPRSGIVQLKESGGVYRMYCGGEFPFLNTTVTGCGWATLLTGVWPKQFSGGNGVTNNGVTKPLEPKSLFLSLIEDGYAKSTLFAVSWTGHFSESGATYLTEKAYAEKNKLDVRWILSPDDAGTTAVMLDALREKDCPDFLMCTLEYCDHAGHSDGQTTQSPAYVQAVKDSDKDLAEIIKGIEARETYKTEDWLILSVTDHGGTGKGHGGWSMTERQIWIAANRPIDVKKYGRWAV
jgi:hypothetical protein